MTEWERHLEKQDKKAKFARKIFYWSIFLILIGMIVFEGIALIPESKPEYEYKEKSIYSGIDIILDTTCGDITISQGEKLGEKENEMD